MKKKKKKIITPSKQQRSPVTTSNDDFCPDPLVDGDSTSFNAVRVFCVKDKTIQYSFREHFLYFPWENEKSKSFSNMCPPAAYHLEKRSDLKNFDFFSFRKDHKQVRFYRFAREQNMCEDLLEYISENLETTAKDKFRQSLEALRPAKLLVDLNQPIKVDPLFKTPKQFCPALKFHFGKLAPATNNRHVDEFTNWYNNIKDDLVDEISRNQDRKISVELISDFNLSEQQPISIDKNFSLNFETVSVSPCIYKFIGLLIRDVFVRKGTKFKFALCASPGFGKTRLKSIFSNFLITDLDDISMLDPIEGPIMQKLVNNRQWKEQRVEYHRIIRTKFKEGIILCQNSHQIPDNIPFINVISPGHIGRRKLWSDRGLYDLVIKCENKIFIHDKLFRNKLVEIIYSELYNSFNYVSAF